MSSERKIESFRANGAPSQGKLTPEGKRRRSSHNAEMHGADSSSILINGESNELLHGIKASSGPSTRATIAFQALDESSSILATYSRFESTFARQHDRAARRLAEWQTACVKAKKPNSTIEPNPRNEHSAPAAG